MRDLRTGKPRHAHWFPWLMLVWTFWIFATPVLFTGSEFQNWMWPTFTSFALFLVMFHRVYYRDRTQVVWNAIGIAVLGFVVTPFNPGAQGYLIYACAFLAFHGTSREAARNMIIVLVLYSVEWQWLGFGWITLASAILVGFAVGFMNINFARKHERDAELMLSHDEIRRLAAVAERERIGRDLHDLLGHTLSLITLKSELANRLFDRDAVAARREIAEVETVARDALAQVRRAVTGIRAAGIAAELASARLAARIERRAPHVRTRRCTVARRCRNRIGDDGARSGDQRAASCACDHGARVLLHGAKPAIAFGDRRQRTRRRHRARQRPDRHARTSRHHRCRTCASNRSVAEGTTVRVTLPMPQYR